MRKIILLLSLAVLSCNIKDTSIVGTWEVISKYYKATYQIIEEGSALKAKVLYYNDDTTEFSNKESDKTLYLFENLQFKKDKYIDAVSGATKTEKERISIKKISDDSLEVTNYILHKPLKEIWIRTNFNRQ